jgi:hypothetical protein
VTGGFPGSTIQHFVAAGSVPAAARIVLGGSAMTPIFPRHAGEFRRRMAF